MPDRPPLDVAAEHLAIVAGILRRHIPDREVWAFGSRARGAAKRYSDLDLAVIATEPLSLVTSAGLADDFSDSDLPWRVDILDWATTSEAFRKIVERDKVVLQPAVSTPEQLTRSVGQPGADSAVSQGEPSLDINKKAP